MRCPQLMNLHFCLVLQRTSLPLTDEDGTSILASISRGRRPIRQSSSIEYQLKKRICCGLILCLSMNISKTLITSLRPKRRFCWNRQHDQTFEASLSRISKKYPDRHDAHVLLFLSVFLNFHQSMIHSLWLWHFVVTIFR